MAQELDLEALLSEAELAVREAGLLFADRALAGHIHHKNATDFVTEVDTGVQELMRRRLAEILPEARFMGEEQDNSGLDTSGLVWILDPVDGTTNFILTQMLEFGQSYDAALKDAQSRGYAEQNPAADVDGIDAGRKICILADMMFGKNVAPARVSMTGISTITAEDAAFAESAGMKLKLLGRAIRQGEQIAVFVSPHFVAGAQPLAPVSGVLNAIEVLGNNIGNAMFFGPGAGGPATASAVLGDVVDIVRNPGRKQPVDWSAEPADLTDPDAFEASFFLRTKLDKAACEQALGEIRWLPDQNGFHGGFTGKTCRKAIAAAGLALDAVWPVLE